MSNADVGDDEDKNGVGGFVVDGGFTVGSMEGIVDGLSDS